MMPDQCLLALDKMDGHLESVAIRPCLFMPLRGAFAASPIRTLTLGTDNGITCTSNIAIDPDRAYAALNNQPHHEETGVSVAFHELTGLRLWLALREAHYCELYVKGDLAQNSLIPSLTGRSGSPLATIGLYEQDTWSLLAIDISSSSSKPQHPFNVTIRSFGEKNTLAQRLKEQVMAWAQVGRPFVWSYSGTMEHLQVRVYPPAARYEPQDAETLMTRGETQIIFSRQ